MSVSSLYVQQLSNNYLFGPEYSDLLNLKQFANTQSSLQQSIDKLCKPFYTTIDQAYFKQKTNQITIQNRQIPGTRFLSNPSHNTMAFLRVFSGWHIKKHSLKVCGCSLDIPFDIPEMRDNKNYDATQHSHGVRAFAGFGLDIRLTAEYAMDLMSVWMVQKAHTWQWQKGWQCIN